MAKNNSDVILLDNYTSLLDLKDTEIAIKKIKDFFEKNLSEKLKLIRVSAPLFVRPETGLNDNLNGVEKPVNFPVKDIDNNICEIVHSLAKWKRMALKKYNFNYVEGLYTDMNAIRKDEDLDNLHSLYVDQWDWEKIIDEKDRNIEYLKGIVTKIYEVFKETENYICDEYNVIKSSLNKNITFITTQELENLYPDLTPKEREIKFTKENGSTFFMKIGGKLNSGIVHDCRAPDYDDWELNGDIVLWYPILERAFEVSSMGIRVNAESLRKQVKISGCTERLEMNFHKEILNNTLPLTIGGGIGQSRICMFFLKKAHIGEVQSSTWPEKMLIEFEKKNINLL